MHSLISSPGGRLGASIRTKCPQLGSPDCGCSGTPPHTEHHMQVGSQYNCDHSGLHPWTLQYSIQIFSLFCFRSNVLPASQPQSGCLLFPVYFVMTMWCFLGCRDLHPGNILLDDSGMSLTLSSWEGVVLYPDQTLKTLSLVPRPPRPAFVTCSGGRIYHVMCVAC